jgi:hypothetical protein
MGVDMKSNFTVEINPLKRVRTKNNNFYEKKHSKGELFWE